MLFKYLRNIMTRLNKSFDQVYTLKVTHGDAAENTFDIDDGGKVKNFQLFINRNVECETMNIVLIPLVSFES